MKSRPVAMGVVVAQASPEEVYQVITGAASQDAVQVQACSKRFTELLQMRGTLDALHRIAAQKDVPLHVRQQSIIQFKNAALPQWRSRKFLSDEERALIRQRSMAFIEEPDETIAKCNKLIVSKIARQDFPGVWPTLVDDLMTAIESGLHERYETTNYDEQRILPLLRSFQLLNGVIKEFANVKMIPGVRIMTQLFARLHTILHNYYSRIATFFSPDTLTNQILDSIRTVNDITLGNLVYKCLSKITVWLWQRTEKEQGAKEGLDIHIPWMRQMFQDSALQLTRLAELRLRLMTSGVPLGPVAQKGIDILTKHVIVLGKFFRRLSQLSHPRFVQMPMCHELILFYWNHVVAATENPSALISDSNRSLYPTRFLLQGLILFKENLAQWSPNRKDTASVLPDSFIQDAVTRVLNRFMPLNAKDLEKWINDPEEWMNMEDKENDQWEFEIRPCSERLLMTLAKEFPDCVTEVLISAYRSIAEQPTIDLDAVIRKEAIYCALGRCCIRLQSKIPFDEWLAQTLSVEARNTNPNFPVIKRRIAWLIGRWVADEATSPNNAVIWETLGYLLTDKQQGTDVVVRLTAATAIGECVNAKDFDPNTFAPFLGSTLSELVTLMVEADTFESKRRVLQALNKLIEYSEGRVIPFIEVITSTLPGLWTGAGEDWMFKSSLLTTVKTLIFAIKEQSTSMGNMVVPLIKDSLSPSARSFLDEDSMKLWLTALRNTMTIQSVNGAPGLVELFPEAISTLASNLDLLGTSTSIVQSYILLDGAFILQNAGTELFTAWLSALKSTAVTLNMKEILDSVNLLVQTSASALWAGPMHDSTFFSHVLLHLLEGKDSTLVLVEHVLLLARIVLADPQVFIQLISATAKQHNIGESTLYTGMLDQWWTRFDNMSEPRYRKLSAMGMAALVSTGRPEVLERIPGDIFNLWLDVFGEIKEVQENLSSLDGMSSPLGSPQSLKRHWELDEAPRAFYQGSEDTPEYTRRKAVYDADPVRTVQLSSFVAQNLRTAEAQCGQLAFQQQYLSKVDPLVLKQIQDELKSV